MMIGKGELKIGSKLQKAQPCQTNTASQLQDSSILEGKLKENFSEDFGCGPTSKSGRFWIEKGLIRERKIERAQEEREREMESGKRMKEREI